MFPHLHQSASMTPCLINSHIWVLLSPTIYRLTWKHIAKAAAVMAELKMRVWNNSHLTLRTKLNVFQAFLLSTLLYDSETWTTYIRQKKMSRKHSSSLPATYPRHLMERQSYRHCCTIRLLEHASSLSTPSYIKHFVTYIVWMIAAYPPPKKKSCMVSWSREKF